MNINVVNWKSLCIFSKEKGSLLRPLGTFSQSVLLSSNPPPPSLLFLKLIMNRRGRGLVYLVQVRLGYVVSLREILQVLAPKKLPYSLFSGGISAQQVLCVKAPTWWESFLEKTKEC